MCAGFGEFGFQLGYSPTQLGYLHRKRLLVVRTDVSHQGTRHAADPFLHPNPGRREQVALASRDDIRRFSRVLSTRRGAFGSTPSHLGWSGGTRPRQVSPWLHCDNERSTEPGAGHPAYRPRGRGGRWHFGQKKLDRFMNAVRRIGVPQRGQGSPSRPYTASERSKYPLSPFTLTYSASKDVPPLP